MLKVAADSTIGILDQNPDSLISFISLAHSTPTTQKPQTLNP